MVGYILVTKARFNNLAEFLVVDFFSTRVEERIPNLLFFLKNLFIFFSLATQTNLTTFLSSLSWFNLNDKVLLDLQSIVIFS
jgi:hypothetical protein